MLIFSVGSMTAVVAATALGRIGAVSLARFSLDQSRGVCGGRVEARTFHAQASRCYGARTSGRSPWGGDIARRRFIGGGRGPLLS